MARTSIAQAVNKMKLGNSDKVALGSLLNAFADDIEALRAKNYAMAQKLDNDAGVTDANFTALTGVAPGSLSVTK